jgi:hypothetical protein
MEKYLETDEQKRAYDQFWAEYYQEVEEIMDFMSKVGWDEIGFGM